MFIGIADDPEYWRDNLNIFVALAPVMLLHNAESVNIKRQCYFYKLQKFIFETSGVHAFIQENIYKDSWLKSLVRIGIVSEFSRTAPGSFIEGVDSREAFDRWHWRIPSGTSWKNLEHGDQICYYKKFQLYDFESSSKNIAKYGQETPPEIDLKKINDS